MSTTGTAITGPATAVAVEATGTSADADAGADGGAGAGGPVGGERVASPSPAPRVERRHRSRSRSWRRAIALAAAAGLVVEAGAYAYVWATTPEPPEPLGPGDVTIELRVEHSLFDVQRFEVYEGTRVRFVLDNGDPIGHELIVGGPEIHAKHAAGTHPKHPPIPGEVSVTPNDRAVTTFRFDDPGPVEFACHLPGHYEYGMHGTIEVVPRS